MWLQCLNINAQSFYEKCCTLPIYIFFMVGRGESFTTMSCIFSKDRSDGPRVWLCTAAPSQPRQGQSPLPKAAPSSSPPRAALPITHRTPAAFVLAKVLGQREARLLYFLYFTDSKLRQSEDYPLKIPQAVHDRAGSWTSGSKIPCLAGGWAVPASPLCPGQAKHWKSPSSG